MFLLVSCKSIDTSLENNLSEIQSTKFLPQNLENKDIASLKNNSLVLSNYLGKEFIKEKDALNYIFSHQEQTSIYNKKIYALISKENKFYPYEIKQDANSSTLKEYSDLRNIKIKSNQDFKINSIVSSRGSIRFFDAPISTFYPNQGKNTQDIITRLRAMETEFTPTKDPRIVFVSTYKITSQKVDKFIESFEAQNKTKEADFLRKLMVNFANKYFYAHDLYYSGNVEKTPEAWRMVFDSGRKSSIFGLDKKGNLPELMALSMNAHIIHDLPFSLKEINFDPKDTQIVTVFDSFNDILFEEKDNIVNSLTKVYGSSVLSYANSFFGSVGTITMKPIFTLMRTIARNQAEFSNKEKIIERSNSYGDSIMKAVLGGNKI